MVNLPASISIVFFVSLVTIYGCVKREGPDCHHDIKFINSSPDTVIFARKVQYIQTGAETLCRLEGSKSAPGATAPVNIYRDCWETSLKDGKTFEFYAVDPAKFNSIDFYDCDSIDEKNDILKIFNLSLDDLEKTNFEVSYP
jgi:hypothetical protein